MKRERYLSLHNFILSHNALKQTVIWGTKFLPGVVYICYPLMILYLLFFRRTMLPGAIAVPAAGFVLCTVIRAKINAPRPYEILDIPSVTKKDTVGKSFPSRHAACGSVIALTALWAAAPLGWFLLAVSLLIPISRVLSGVHFIRDVLAGWLLGALVGCIVFLF